MVNRVPLCTLPEDFEVTGDAAIVALMGRSEAAGLGAELLELAFVALFGLSLL